MSLETAHIEAVYIVYFVVHVVQRLYERSTIVAIVMRYWLVSPWSIPNEFNPHSHHSNSDKLRCHHAREPYCRAGHKSRSNISTSSGSADRDREVRNYHKYNTRDYFDRVTRDGVTHGNYATSKVPPLPASHDIHHNYMEPTASFLAKTPSRRSRCKIGKHTRPSTAAEKQLKGCLKREHVRSASPKSVSWDEAERIQSSALSQTIHDDRSEDFISGLQIQSQQRYINSVQESNEKLSDTEPVLPNMQIKDLGEVMYAKKNVKPSNIQLKKCKKCGRNTVDENQTCLPCYTDIIQQLSSQLAFSPRTISQHDEMIRSIRDKELSNQEQKYVATYLRHPTISIITNGASRRFIQLPCGKDPEADSPITLQEETPQALVSQNSLAPKKEETPQALVSQNSLAPKKLDLHCQTPGIDSSSPAIESHLDSKSVTRNQVTSTTQMRPIQATQRRPVQATTSTTAQRCPIQANSATQRRPIQATLTTLRRPVQMTSTTQRRPIQTTSTTQRCPSQATSSSSPDPGSSPSEAFSQASSTLSIGYSFKVSHSDTIIY